MAVKLVQIDGIGPVNLYKRRGARNLRLSVGSTGQIRVTMPHWVPYSAGITFAKQKKDWLTNQVKPVHRLTDGQAIGKKHILSFVSQPGLTKAAGRLGSSGDIVIKLPESMPFDDTQAQKVATTASIRALRREAEDILPGRLRELASQHGFKYRSVEVKQLRGRWGSCSHRQEIVLNCFLMQLPWDLIDYVLLHELVHTKILAHGPKFWAEMSEHVEDLASKRKAIRTHRPAVQPVLI